MNFGNSILVMLLLVGALVLGWWGFKHFFSADARWERRRRRSNAPIRSKGRGPSVRFSVRTKKQPARRK